MEPLASRSYVNSKISGGGTTGFTPEGGVYSTLINNTGAVSVKGTIVSASLAVDKAVSIAPVNSDMPMRIIYESGIANGQAVKVIFAGCAEVLMKNGLAATRGFWCGVSDVAGRMYQSSSPPSTTEHSREIGHCLETKASGTNVLALIDLHFN